MPEAGRILLCPSYIWSLSADPPSPALPTLTYGVCPGCCPSSCILSTYMNIPAPASHNLMACAFLVQGNVQYKLKASNKEDDTVHIVEARVLGQDGQILAWLKERAVSSLTVCHTDDVQWLTNQPNHILASSGRLDEHSTPLPCYLYQRCSVRV